MRIAIGGFWHETNTFAAGRTRVEDFKAYQYAEGKDILTRYADVRNEIGGFIHAAREFGFDLIPTLYAAAVPSGIVSSEAHGFLVNGLLDGIQKSSSLDGVLLALHGAMVAEGVDDVEGQLLKRVRDLVGNHCPIVVTLDLHANISHQAVESADLIIGYDTYPHTDMFERGVEAASLMHRFAADGFSPVSEFAKLAFITPPQGQLTTKPPMADIMERVAQMENDPKILAITVAPGFPYSDIDRLGIAILVQTNDDPQLARKCADELCEMVWARRGDFDVKNVPVEQAVKRAIAAPQGPVILVDVADNVGGGSPGDGTVLLEALIRHKARDAVVTISDPETVALAKESIGMLRNFTVGGKNDRHHGLPVQVLARVRLVSDGVYFHEGSYMTGQRTSMGVTAVLECGGVDIVVTEHKVMPFDAQYLKSVAIEPSKKRIIVVKSAIAWQAAFGAIARDAIFVDTPGICSSNLHQLEYRNVPRPMMPLDPILDFALFKKETGASKKQSRSRSAI